VRSGQGERDAIRGLIGERGHVGVRMHWLYFDDDSPSKLEAAGFHYDSTLGYNETIGFRSGTAQVHKLLGTQALLELPMHVMDTALFRPHYLNLTYAQAAERIEVMIEAMSEFGGVLTLNWHDRSIAPERLWGEFYTQLLLRLRQKRAWCTNASNAVAWFKKRRSAQFRRDGERLHVVVPDSDESARTPPLLLRRHRHAAASSYVDVELAVGATFAH
jgi:hypothetical protein